MANQKNRGKNQKKKKSWKEVSLEIRKNEKFWVVLRILNGIIVVGLFTLYTFHFHSKSRVTPQFCESPQCIILAQELKAYSDTATKSCEDFYKATCENYKDHQALDRHRDCKKRKAVNKLVRGFLQRDESTFTSESESAIKLIFGKCDELSRNTSYLDIFKDIKKIGSWPVLEHNWKDSMFNLDDVIAKLVKLGSTDFGLFKLELRKLAFGHFAVFVSSKQEQNIHQLEKTILGILKANGIQQDRKELSDDLKDYSDFKNHLKEFYQEETYIEYRLYAGSIVENLGISSLTTQMALKSTGLDVFNHVNQRTLITNSSLFFGEENNLGMIIQKTPKRTLANFLIFHFIDVMTTDLANATKACKETLIDLLPRASIQVLSRNFVNEDAQDDMVKMAQDLKTKITEMIDNSPFFTKFHLVFDAEEQKKLIQKVKAIGIVTEYPQEVLDRDFERLNLTPSDSIYRTIQKLRRLRSEQLIEHLGGDLDPTDTRVWGSAHYDQTTNNLTIFAPIIDGPYFDTSYPNYVNQFLMGFILGRELGRSLDSVRIRKDEKGQTENWLKPESLKRFDEHLKCWAEKYDKSADPLKSESKGIRQIEGRYIQNEMFADFIGHEASWRAFMKLDVKNEEVLETFKVIKLRRMFFNVQALYFCRPPSGSTDWLSYQEHHQHYSFRVNGAFKNMPQFALAFECASDDDMNPQNKCSMF